MTGSPDTNESAWDWTVTLLNMYGKRMHLVPPCHHLPTYRHVSKLDKEAKASHELRSSIATAVNKNRGPATPNQARANNHIWRDFNKEVPDTFYQEKQDE